MKRTSISWNNSVGIYWHDTWLPEYCLRLRLDGENKEQNENELYCDLQNNGISNEQKQEQAQL